MRRKCFSLLRPNLLPAAPQITDSKTVHTSESAWRSKERNDERERERWKDKEEGERACSFPKKEKKKKEKKERLTGEDQPIDGVEQPPELPVRDVEADGHRAAARRLDPLDVSGSDVGPVFFFFERGEKNKRGRG